MKKNKKIIHFPDNLVNIYYCAKCGKQIKEEDISCHNCKSILGADGTVKTNKISEKRFKEIEEEANPTFKLKSWYQLLIYRIGFIFFCFTGIGLIIFLSRQWEEDNLKRKKENQKLKNKLEKFFYVWGWLVVIYIPIALLIGLFCDVLKFC